MIALFAIFWGLALVTLAVTRFSSLSVLLMSSLLYSSPVFWTATSNPVPALVWILVLGMAAVAQAIISRRRVPARNKQVTLAPRKDSFINLIFNAAATFLFLVVVARSGGIGVFFEGKYGAVPGEHILIYYSWNSLLIVTCAYNLGTRKLTDYFNLICLLQIFLIFVGGDRTLPLLYIVILLTYYFDGVKPISLFSGRRAIFAIALVVLVPLLAVSKTIYTLLPTYGFSFKLLELIFSDSDQFFFFITKDFEPTHAHWILVYATSGPVDYSLFDLIPGIFALVPGSSAVGIDPHAFSLAVKTRYFTSWSDEAGVGAHFWAQGWVVGGWLGVVGFAMALIWVLIRFDKAMCRNPETPLSRALVASLIAVLAFYVQRNSMEQILSFAGRYATIWFLLSGAGFVAWRLLPKKRNFA